MPQLDQSIDLDTAGAELSFRVIGPAAVRTVDVAGAGVVPGAVLAPWRTFRWWYGQRHYSGTFWSSTQGGHVIYESRLELSALLSADFDPTVTSIAAQPFLLEADVEGVRRRHIPDFLLTTAEGPLVVEVKPRERLSSPKVGYTLVWAQQLIAEIGWTYEVWTEPPPVERANLGFLAGYRAEHCITADVLSQLRGRDLVGLSIHQVLAAYPVHRQPLARAALLHLLWRGELRTDLASPLQSTSILRQGGRR